MISFDTREIRILDSNGAVEKGSFRLMKQNETMTDAMICYTGELPIGCLISLTIFSFVSLASLGPGIAIGTADH